MSNYRNRLWSTENGELFLMTPEETIALEIYEKLVVAVGVNLVAAAGAKRMYDEMTDENERRCLAVALDAARVWSGYMAKRSNR